MIVAHGSHAAGRRGIVARSAGDGNAGRKSQFRKPRRHAMRRRAPCPRPEPACGCGQDRLQQAGHRPTHACQHRARRFRRNPTSPRLPRRSARASDSPWAAEPLPRGRKLRVRSPPSISGFGAVKPGNTIFAGQPPELRIGIEYGCFLVTARVVPQDAGPDHLAIAVCSSWRHACAPTNADAAHPLASSAAWVFRRIQPMQRAVAAIQLSGSCSDHPGCSRCTVNGAARRTPRMRWLSSISSALRDEVSEI